MKLSPLFSDGAVLQREKEIIVFGSAEGHVRAEFGGIVREAEPVEGRFELSFPPQPAGGPYELKVSADGEETVVRDILIGDVILLGGQSNAEMQLCALPECETVRFADDGARVYHAKQLLWSEKFDDSWHAMSCENSGSWSAIGFYLARRIRAEQGVPVGIVCCYQGASVIQSFMSPEAAARFAFAEHERHPDHTNPEYAPFNVPSIIYRTMLKPLVPYQISKVVWYQGESNTAPIEGSHYGEMLKTLIGEWRGWFRDEKLPFILIQINDFETPFSKEGWQIVQAEQEKTARQVPYCALVSIRDMGQHDLIHPLNKREVTDRVYAAMKTF